MSAIFSPCRTWRYTLERKAYDGIWPNENTVLFICLNPSTADEISDDPTVRRCIGYAHRWMFGRLVVCNIFGLRSTDPRALYEHEDPVGPENDLWIEREAAKANMIVLAWGTHGALQHRGGEVARLLAGMHEKVYVLGLTKEGYPRHPLYLRADLEPQLLAAVAAA